VATSAKQNEIVALQQEITSEVHRDAASIATGVFGENKNHPDMAQVSNAQLDDLYRSKYQANDRQWLQAEAKRDPQQFLDVAKRIGVEAPTSAPGAPPVQPANAFEKAMTANAGVALPPALPPAPVAPAIAAAPLPIPAAAPVPLPPAAAAPPPAILGPNGMPLPPSGM
jgi:hypothetical protein